MVLLAAVLCVILGSCTLAQSPLAPAVTPGIPSINELIEGTGLECTNILITTEDGHQLWMHRMGNNTGTPVLLVHGFLNAADIWLTRGLWDTDLAYMLAKEGFDVYLVNTRGNIFNPSHTKYKRSDLRFWDFSFHEVGYYDIPAAIDWILNSRQLDQLIYMGHSLGTTTFMVMASTRPEYNSKIKLGVMLAPIAFFNYNELAVAPIRFAVNYRRQIWNSFQINNQVELVPRNARSVQMLLEFCRYNSSSQPVCLDLLGVYSGENRENINKKTIAFQVAMNPAGSSAKLLYHIGQLVAASNFIQFDYGPRENMLRYNSTRPPVYPVEKITAPIALFWSYNDNLSSVKSIDRLRAALKNVVYEKPNKDPKWTHFDYFVGINAKEMLYYEVVDLIKRYR